MKRIFITGALLSATLLAHAATPAGTKLADEANAASTQFKLAAPAVVSYGAGTAWTERTLDAGSYVCHPSTFGLPGVMASPRKQCKYTLKGGGVPVVVVPPMVDPVDPVLGAKLAPEHIDFVLTTPTRVAFGVPGKVRVSELPVGKHLCRSHLWQDIDPAVGSLKACYGPTTLPVTTPVVVTPPVEPPVVVVPPVVEPDPTPVNSAIDTPEKYRAVAATMGTAAGVEYLRGKPSSLAAPTLRYPGPRASFSMADLSGQHNPPKIFPDGVAGGRGCGVGDQSWCGEYQLGKIEGRPGDYSSSIANIGFVPDTNPAGFPAKRYPGVGSYQVLNVGHGTISIKPECSWTTYINKALNNCDTDENTARLAGIQGGSPIGTIPMNDKVVQVMRAYGRGGWNTNSLVLMSDGWMFGVGSNTAHNFFKVNVARAGLQVTGLTASNSGEFVFVTAWDTVNVKGKVIVVAMSDACQWCANEPLSKWYGNWGNHTQEYPGLPGLGNYSGGKVIGEIDLPAGVTAPTSIAVTTGVSKDREGYQVIDSFWTQNILTEANRKRFYDGNWTTAIARTGVLVVGSKSEKRAAVIDLRPLFMYYREQYLTKNDAGFQALIASRGPAATQWPYTFDVAPAQKPVVVKTIDLPSEVTSLALSRTGAARALIGGLDGKARVFDLGSRYLDQKAVAVGAPSDIAQVAELDVGGNVTAITYLKEKGMNGPQGNRNSLLYGSEGPEDRYWWTLSRETGEAKLWQFDAAMRSAKVFKSISLRPTVTDPITIEDVDNHGAESYLLAVGDYTGRALHSFWYAPIVWWTDGGRSGTCTQANPCKPDGDLEYAGKVNVPGRVHSLGVANIN